MAFVATVLRCEWKDGSRYVLKQYLAELNQGLIRLAPAKNHLRTGPGSTYNTPVNALEHTI